MVQRTAFLAIGHFPKPELQSFGTRVLEGQTPIIRAEAKAESRGTHQRSTASRVPKASGVIPAVGGEQITRVAKGETNRNSLVTLQNCLETLADNVPNVNAGIIASGR
jgi:hypothetical protein